MSLKVSFDNLKAVTELCGHHDILHTLIQQVGTSELLFIFLNLLRSLQVWWPQLGDYFLSMCGSIFKKFRSREKQGTISTLRFRNW